MNATNSGSYSLNFALSGTLDPGDFIVAEVLSGSDVMASGSYVSGAGGENTGSISPLNLSMLTDGTYALSGSVYTSVPALSASGITGTLTVDATFPAVSSTGTVTVGTGTAAFSGIAVTDANFSGATLSYSGVSGGGTGSVSLTGTAGNLTGSVSGLQSNTTYLYVVSATDLAGNSTSLTAGTFATAFDWQSLYAGIGSGVTAAGIANNFTGVTNANVTGYSGLYFEKTGYGKITFSGALNLTDSGTISFLQNLGSYLDMTNGRVGFAVSSGSTASGSLFQSAGASLDVYFSGQPFTPGSMDPSAVVVRDNDGNVLTSSGILSNLLCAVSVGGTQTCTFDASHFTTFDFKPILTDVTVSSNNVFSGSLAKLGDTVSLSFTGSETLTGVTATMSGVNNGSSLSVTGS